MQNKLITLPKKTLKTFNILAAQADTNAKNYIEDKLIEIAEMARMTGEA